MGEIKGLNIAYVRVSTTGQSGERQINNLKRYDIEKWFKEETSGKTTKRPVLEEMINFIREGDTVYVDDFSRLARSTRDLLDLVELFEKKGVDLVSNKENIDTSTPTGRLMLTMIGAIAQFEREVILERQREGIAIAKAAGKYKGRRPVEIDEEVFAELYEKYSTRQMSKAKLAKELKISRPTLDKMLKEKGLM